MVLTNPVSGQSLINAVNDNTERSVSSETFLQDYRKYWWRRRTCTPPSYTVATETTKVVVKSSSTSSSEYYYPNGDVYISSSFQFNFWGTTVQLSDDKQKISNGSGSWYISDPTSKDFGGKYICIEGDGSVYDKKLWYIEPSDGFIQVAGVYYYINAKELTVSAPILGEWSLISSDTSTAYPKSNVSGGYEYEFLGDALNSALGVKIQSGYYLGTAVTGATLELDFPFVPKAIIIFGYVYTERVLFIDKNAVSDSKVDVDWWFGDYSIKIQINNNTDWNRSGERYNYIVFG